MLLLVFLLFFFLSLSLSVGVLATILSAGMNATDGITCIKFLFIHLTHCLATVEVVVVGVASYAQFSFVWHLQRKLPKALQTAVHAT